MNEPVNNPRRSLMPLIVVGIVAVIAGALAARFMLQTRAQAPPLTTGTALTPAHPVPQFSLLDGDGKAFTRDSLRGHWSLVFFGFTHCPDICPTTLSVLGEVHKQLANLPAGQQPAVIFISVDPQRDTPDVVGKYVHFFSSDFVGVTGTVEAIDQLTSAAGVPVARVPLPSGDYTVDHSGAIFVIDPDAALHAVLSSPDKADAISADYRRLIASF
jgi:protein SCO1/2